MAGDLRKKTNKKTKRHWPYRPTALKPKTLSRLEKLKIHPRQGISDVIDILIDHYVGVVNGNENKSRLQG
jgi:hypothetical protein